jgi:hypothetical protein
MVAPVYATMQEISILNFYHDMRLYKMKRRAYVAILP